MLKEEGRYQRSLVLYCLVCWIKSYEIT